MCGRGIGVLFLAIVLAGCGDESDTATEPVAAEAPTQEPATSEVDLLVPAVSAPLTNTEALPTALQEEPEERDEESGVRRSPSSAVPVFETPATPGLALDVHPEIGGPLVITREGTTAGRCFLELHNRGSKRILAVSNGDGSEEGWRTPIVRWHIVDEDGETVEPVAPSMRCGNINPLERGELTILKPGESVLMDSWRTHPPMHVPPGRYTAVVEFEHDPDRRWVFHDELEYHDLESLIRIEKSQAYLVRSVPFTLIVNPTD